MQTERKSTVAPLFSRRDAWIQAAGSFSLAAGIAFIGEPGVFGYLGALFFFACGIPGVVALLFPERTKVGIIFDQNCFEHFAALRGAHTIFYDDITRIEALATGGGEQGDAVDLIVHTASQKVRVREADLFTGFFEVLAAVPGFQRSQYAVAAQHTLRGWDHFIGKKFVVMCRAGEC
jgi:hypothetical protein